MLTTNYTPELLSPAGSLKAMRFAFAYGADAIYAGMPRYSLRVRNNEFSLEKLDIAIKEAHSINKKFYVVNNISPHNSKLTTFIDDIRPIVKMQPDAFIMADPGLIMLVQEHFPSLPIHLSVQANAVNWASVKFWHKLGITRIILSRELSLTEIEQITAKVPEVELEVFVHGALCIAYSGRCLLSGYMNKRDPNQGACTNACRWNYSVHSASETDEGNFVPATVNYTELKPPTHIETPFLLQEKNRPNDLMPTWEDEHGTYIFNSKDLRAIQHIPTLMHMGVVSFKIEGRTKSHYYVARTAQTYRKAIDNVLNGIEFDTSLVTDLDNLANRGYTEGFYRRHTSPSDTQNYNNGSSTITRQQFVGEVIERRNDKLVINVKNKFSINDTLEIMTPKGNFDYKIKDMWDNETEEAIEVAKGSGYIIKINNILQHLEQDLIPYCLVTRYL